MAAVNLVIRASEPPSRPDRVNDWQMNENFPHEYCTRPRLLRVCLTRTAHTLYRVRTAIFTCRIPISLKTAVHNLFVVKGVFLKDLEPMLIHARVRCCTHKYVKLYTHSMKQPDLYYFEAIIMTLHAQSNFVWRIRAAGEYSLLTLTRLVTSFYGFKIVQTGLFYRISVLQYKKNTSYVVTLHN